MECFLENLLVDQGNILQNLHVFTNKQEAVTAHFIKFLAKCTFTTSIFLEKYKAFQNFYMETNRQSNSDVRGCSYIYDVQRGGGGVGLMTSDMTGRAFGGGGTFGHSWG